MKTFALQVTCILGCMAAMLVQTGCTAPQVTGVINGLNQVNDQVFSPIAEKQDVQGLGPYIRLGATFARNILYEVIDLVRIFSPNAGEPTTQPSAALPARFDQPVQPPHRTPGIQVAQNR